MSSAVTPRGTLVSVVACAHQASTRVGPNRTPVRTLGRRRWTRGEPRVDSTRVGAILRIQTTSGEAHAAFIDVVQDESIVTIPLGESTGMYEVIFRSPDVQIGTGFVTLQGLLNEHTPGAGDGIVRLDLG